MFHKAKAAKCLRCHDHRGNIKRTDRPSGIILASGCCYLGRPENPPEHWVENPPSGAHAHKVWPCDTSAGGAPSQIYLGNQNEPAASPNPAGECSAFLPVMAPRFITDGVNENTNFARPKNKWLRLQTPEQNIYQPRSFCIRSDTGTETGLRFFVHHNIKIYYFNKSNE